MERPDADRPHDADGTAPAVRPGAISALLAELVRSDDRDRGSRWEQALEPGTVVGGRFELIQELGRGGFGVVWEARDRTLGRRVAFKALFGRSSAATEEERVLREAEVAARLSHPNIVTLHDVGRGEDGPYLVLELLRGRTLAQRLDVGPLTVREAVRIAVEVASGLAHAHAHGVVHRDLTPGNVFLCDGGQVKVLDLGMAAAFGTRKLHGGTPSYMAPEQSRGAPEDERTDVFALGVLMYRMLVNELPWEKGKAREDLPPAPELQVADAPALGALIARMLDRDPVKRPRDAGEVVTELAAFQQELSREPATSGVVRARRRRGRRSLVAWIAAAAVVLMVAAAAVTWAVMRIRGGARSEASVAVLPFASLSRDEQDAAFTDGLHLELITQLAKVSGLKVIGPGSVSLYKESARDLRAIASALSVRAVVEGSVQRSGRRVRVTAHLVDPATGRELWAESFDRDLADIFDVQSNVALNIANGLGTTLSAAERRRVERRPTTSPEAHELYFRARHLWFRSFAESDNVAADALLQRALALDPSFAPAHALLAALETRSGTASACASSLSHVTRAAALDPELPDAHWALSYHHRYCGNDVERAVTALDAAARLAPGNAEIRSDLGAMKVESGRVDAGLEDLRAAFALEPRSVGAAYLYALALAFVRDYDQARTVLERVQDLTVDDPAAGILRVLVDVRATGDLEAARRWLTSARGELPADVNLVELLALLPGDAVELARANGLPDPITTQPVNVPRAFVTGRANAALGNGAMAQRDFAAATAALEAEATTARDDLARVLLARAYAGAGRADDSRRAMREARERARSEFVRAYVVILEAEIAAAAGAKQEALDALTAALERPGWISPASLRVDPRFASLRGEPRFEALLARDAR